MADDRRAHPLPWYVKIDLLIVSNKFFKCIIINMNIDDDTLVFAESNTKNNNAINNEIAVLIDYIYLNFPLDHKKMKPLYENIKVPISFDSYKLFFYDKDDFYSDKNMIEYYKSSLIFVPYPHEDDKYIYGFKKKFNQLMLHGSKEQIRPVKKIHKYLIEHSPRELKIGDYKKLVVCNDTNYINKSVNGVRCLDWKLHCWKEYKIKKNKGVSLHDLIIAVHKIKCHKFQGWCNDIKCRIEEDGDTIKFHVQFYY